MEKVDLRVSAARRRETVAAAAIVILQACIYQQQALLMLLDSEDDGSSSSESENSDSSEDSEESDKDMPLKRCRLAIDRPDYKSSSWWRMLENENAFLDKNSQESATFRRRFRVPYPLFLDIVKLARKEAWLTRYEEDVGRRPCLPLKLKVLGALQILGRGKCFDDISQMSLMSEETARTSFHAFCKRFSKHLSEKWIQLQTGDDTTKVMEAYEAQGFPGAVGSTDVTYISGDRVASSRAQSYTGKEGYPTLAYEVTVDFSRRILAMTHSFPGAGNDKSIARYDAAVKAIREEEPFKFAKYKLCDAESNPALWTGAYAILDGGYHKWTALKCPFKHPDNMKRKEYSTRMESVRKDVKCAFGILKGRFRILKGAIRYHKQEGIDHIFYTCCILHNMLLAMDGLDDLEPDTEISGASVATLPDVPARDVRVDAGFGKLRDALVENFAYRTRNRNVAWIDCFSLCTWTLNVR